MNGRGRGRRPSRAAERVIGGPLRAGLVGGHLRGTELRLEKTNAPRTVHDAGAPAGARARRNARRGRGKGALCRPAPLPRIVAGGGVFPGPPGPFTPPPV